MSNVFKSSDKDSPKLKRNSFDKSHSNNFTMTFGKLYPCLVQEVIPGETVHIQPSMGFNFLPMVYPVQTPMYVNLHLYYVRNRALVDGWTDFINGGPNANNFVMPYIKNIPSFFTSGSLADYLGIPSELDGYQIMDDISYSSFLTRSDAYFPFTNALPLQYNSFTFVPSSSSLESLTFFTRNGVTVGSPVNLVLSNDTIYDVDNLDGLFPYVARSSSATNEDFRIPFSALGSNFHFVTTLDESRVPEFVLNLSNCTLSDIIRCRSFACNDPRYSSTAFAYASAFYQGFLSTIPANRIVRPVDPDNTSTLFSVSCVESGSGPVSLPSFYLGVYSYLTGEVIDLHYELIAEKSVNNSSYFTFKFVTGTSEPFDYLSSLSDDFCLFVYGSAHNVDDIFYQCSSSSQGTIGYPSHPYILPYNYCCVPRILFESSDFATPFSSGNMVDDPAIPVSALPFRAYEAIYNAYYRNQQIEPLLDSSDEPIYNKWNTTTDQGADTTNYHFFYRNWEKDYFTSMLPSPQQGEAPLVGVSGTGTFTVQTEDGLTYNIEAVVDPNDGRLTGITYYDEGTPLGSVQRLQTAITSGMSINDFRLVNSMQRFLEKNIRSGYRYRDLMRAHHGVDIHYNPLDMPEFIGGISDVVNVGKVVNQTEISGGSALGSFAGLATSMKSSNHSINHYCDEHGYIIGIISVTPLPTYSQHLEKHWLKTHFLDYYDYEFAKIGMQPVDYREVSPVLRFNESLFDSSKSVYDVFGYQRAWGDIMSKVDEAHGLFRNELRDFVMYRVFGQSPVLGSDFIHVDETQLNNVFADTTTSDKILGVVNFNSWSDMPVLRHVIPSLE